MSVLISMCSSMPRAGEDVEHLVERRHAGTAAVAQLRRRQLGRGPIGDRPLPFGRAVERRIVDHDQLSVARDDGRRTRRPRCRARACARSRRGCSPATGCARRDGRRWTTLSLAGIDQSFHQPALQQHHHQRPAAASPAARRSWRCSRRARSPTAGSGSSGRSPPSPCSCRW